MDNDRVLVLSPGDEATGKIARAFASRTAGLIMQSLADGPQSATEIAESLSIPITTVVYHLEKLQDAGILEVASTRWSEKGREVKLYRQAERVVIVAPTTRDLRSLLTKYGALLGVVAAASVMMVVISTLVGPMEPPVSGAGVLDTRAEAAPLPMGSALLHQLVLAFFGGGCLVILALMVYELWAWRRRD